MNVVLIAQQAYSQAQVRDLKNFYSDFFDQQIHDTDAKTLGNETIRAFDRMYNELSGFQTQVDKYPFLESLRTVLAQLKDIKSENYTWCLQELPSVAEQLLDAKEQVIDPVRKLLTGAQKEIYDNARSFAAEHRANFDYLDSANTTALQELLRDPECFRGQKMQRLKDVCDKLQAQVGEVIQKQVAQAVESVNERRNRIVDSIQFKSISDALRDQVTKEFNLILEGLKSETVVPVIKDRLSKFEGERYAQLLSMLEETKVESGDAGPAVPQHGVQLQDGGLALDSPLPGSNYVAIKNVNPDFDQPWLANEEDVARYIDALRSAMVVLIRSGRRIHI